MVFLLVLPFYKYGYFNDVVSRASIPALLCLWVLVARVLFSTTTSNAKRYFLIILILIGAATPMLEIFRHVRNIYIHKTLIQQSEYKEIP